MWDEAYWTDPAYQGLSFDACGVFFYLSCNLHVRPSGVYELALRVASFETRLNEERLRRSLAELSELVVLDEQVGVVWVKPFFRQHSSSWKFAVSAVDHLFAVGHESFTKRWLAYNAQVIQDRQVKQRIQERMRGGSAYPIEPPPVRGENEERREENKRDSGPARSTLEPVFLLWQGLFGHPTAKFTDGRLAKLKTRSKSYGVSELCDAVRGYASDPWRHGEGNGPSAIVRHELETIMRSDTQVDRGLEMFRRSGMESSGSDPLLALAEEESTKRGGGR